MKATCVWLVEPRGTTERDHVLAFVHKLVHEWRHFGGNRAKRDNWWIGPYVPSQPGHDVNLILAERKVQDAVYFAHEMDPTESAAWASMFKEAWTREL